MEERLRFVARLLEGEGMSEVCRNPVASTPTICPLLTRANFRAVPRRKTCHNPTQRYSIAQNTRGSRIAGAVRQDTRTAQDLWHRSRLQEARRQGGLRCRGSESLGRQGATRFYVQFRYGHSLPGQAHDRKAVTPDIK